MKRTVLMLCLASCGNEPIADRPTKTEEPLTNCEVTLPGTPVRIATWNSGVLVGLDDGTLLRGEGAGCELHLAQTGEVGELLDVDAAGNAYVKTADAFQSEHFPETFGDLVVRIAPDGTSTSVVGAGRGIWGFGVSASGHTMWVSACGPTGVLSTSDLSSVLAANPPWELGTAVLTGDTTYWSSRTESCTERGSVCTLALTRSTPEGERSVMTVQREIGLTLLLARCGDGLCTAIAQTVTQLDAEGALVREFSRELLRLEDTDRVMSFGSTSRGLYVLSEGPGGRHLRFTP
jgi:hypothetical protein